MSHLYEIEVRHEGLNKYRVIRGNNLYVVEQKAEMQKRAWDVMWEKKQEQIRQKQEMELAAQEKQQKKELAERLTNEAIEQLKKLKKHFYTL